MLLEIAGIIALVLSPVLYIVPGLVARDRGHHQQAAIWVLNILAGWTLLGWIAALVWASTAVRKETAPA